MEIVKEMDETKEKEVVGFVLTVSLKEDSSDFSFDMKNDNLPNVIVIGALEAYKVMLINKSVYGSSEEK